MTESPAGVEAAGGIGRRDVMAAAAPVAPSPAAARGAGGT
jgi:hypothetical protein